MENHIHSFGFEKKYVGAKVGLYEPKEGETGFSIQQGDWVCRCGITRRVLLNLQRKKLEGKDKT